MVKGRQDFAPQEVESILSWAEDNLVTINLTKTKEMVVRGKVESPLPSIISDIKQEPSLKLLGVYFHSDPTNWDQQFDNLLSKAGRGMHILRVCKKYGYSLDYLQYLLHSLIISLFTYGISVWSTATYDKYLSRIDKFQKRAFRFGFLKEVMPVACLLETSDRNLWKGITSSTESPLADFLPSKARPLRNRGHTYILPQIRTERFKRCFISRCIFNYYI